jgi:hypothetical protein
MAEVHLDHPGDVTWFKGYGPLPTLGPCEHVCEHRAIGDIAWGPDFERYTLIKCDDPDGCAGRCRGWFAEYPPAEARAQGKLRYRTWGWQQVA